MMVRRFLCWVAVTVMCSGAGARDQQASRESPPAAAYESVSTGNRAIDMLIESPPLAASAPVEAASAPGRRAKAAAGKASDAADGEVDSLREALLRDAAALASAEQKRVRTATEQAIAEAEPEAQPAAAGEAAGAVGDPHARDERDGVLSGLRFVIGLLREYRNWLLAVALAAVGLAIGFSVTRDGRGRARQAGGAARTSGGAGEAMAAVRRPRSKH